MDCLKIHPVYKNYGYNTEDGNIYYIPLNRIVKQNLHTSGYTMCCVSDGSIQKSYFCHRFIFECFHEIPKGYEIDHMDKNKTNNKIENLRCITISENRKNRDHTNIIKIASMAYKLVRFIKAINVVTNDYNCFKSKSQTSKFYGISPAMVYLVCEGKNNVQTANTAKGRIRFEYIEEKDVDNFIKIPHGKLGKTYKNKTI